MLRAVIFDIDGTLVDSVDLHARAWQDAFRHFGRKVPYEQVRHQIGKGGDQLMPVFFSEEELNRFGEEMEEYRGELYKRACLPLVRPFPRVRKLFLRVHAGFPKMNCVRRAASPSSATRPTCSWVMKSRRSDKRRRKRTEIRPKDHKRGIG